MARVPIVVDNSQRLSALPGQRFNAPDIGAAGRAVGAALGRTGDALNRAGRDEEEIRTIYAEARAKELDNEYQTWEREQLFGDDGYYMQRNADAVHARQPTEEAINEQIGLLLERTQDHRERGMLEGVLNRRRQEAFNGIARYSQGQAMQFAIAQSNARIGNAQENYVRFHRTDPERAAAERATIMSEVRRRADLEGMTDADVVDAAMEDALSGMHVTLVEAEMLRDPTQASAYLEEWRHEIDPAQQITLDARMRPLLVDHDARGFADMAEQFVSPTDTPIVEEAGAAPGAPVARVSTDAVWQAMIWQESRGRQTGANGQPITSSAGAIGIAQVMPGTAREVAASLGIPFDEQRYRTDAAYNERLGRAYYAQMLRRYNGNVAYAVAAYNAGPGRVDRAIQNGASWRNHLPAETRNYLQVVFGRAGGGEGVAMPDRGVPGGPSAGTIAAQDLQTQLQWAEEFIPERLTGRDPLYIQQVVDATKAQIRQRHGERMQAIQADQAAAWEAAQEQAFALGQGFTSITQINGYQNLPIDQRMSLDGLAQRNVSAAQQAAQPQTDWGFYAYMHELADTDPRALQAIPLEEARGRLNDTHFAEFSRLRTSRATESDRENAVTARDVITYTQQSLNAAGLVTGNSERAREDAPVVQQFTQAMMRWVEDFRRREGRQPTEREVQVQGDRMLVRMTYERPGDFFGSWWNDEEEIYAFQGVPDRYSDSAQVVVPDNIRVRIRREFPGISDADMQAIYMRYRGVEW